LEECGRTNDFYKDSYDATKRRSICVQVKLMMGLKCLSFGVSPSLFQMGELTSILCVKNLCSVLCQDGDFRNYYLQAMNRADTKRVVELHNHHHGVNKLIGSLDCMHIGGKRCPLAWHGQFKGKEKAPTIVLEAYCDCNLWIWHSAFCYAGTLNDINIWDQSPLIKSFLGSAFTENVDFEYELGGKVFGNL
jgi:Plant transposon protein